MRQREAARLSASQLEHLFALEFVLDQLERNICDLDRCVREWLPPARAKQQPATADGSRNTQ